MNRKCISTGSKTKSPRITQNWLKQWHTHSKYWDYLQWKIIERWFIFIIVHFLFFFKIFFKICWFVTILLLFCVLVLWLQAYGILAPWPGIEPTSPALKGKVLTTRPPGKFLSPFSKCCSWEHVLVACMSSARPDLCFCSDFPHHNISPNTLFYSYMCNRSLYRDLCWDRCHKRGNGKLIPLLSFVGKKMFVVDQIPA